MVQGYRFGKCILSPIFISREAQDTLSLLDKPLFCTVWGLTPTVKIDSTGTLTLWSLCRTPTHSIKWARRVGCAFGHNVLLLLLLTRWRVHASVLSPSAVPNSATPWTVAARPLCPWDSAGRSSGVGCHAFLQGTFLTQGLNPRLLNWQADSLPLYRLGSFC